MTTRSIHVSPRDRGAALVAFAGGTVLLLARLEVLGRPNAAAMLLVTYAAVGAAAVAAPIPPSIAQRASAATSVVVFVFGIAAVALAGRLTGPAVAVPASAWSPLFNAGAAVAEEALFRRLAYGWLERYGAAVAVVTTAVAFGAVHVPVYGFTALPVDVGAGLLLSWQRAATGSWSVPAATHVAANLLAVIP